MTSTRRGCLLFGSAQEGSEIRRPADHWRQGDERLNRIFFKVQMTDARQAHQRGIWLGSQIIIRIADWDHTVFLAPKKQRRGLYAGERLTGFA